VKKIISLVLTVAVIVGILSTFGAISVGAVEADYTAEIWSPLEIQLTSEKTYKNAYAEAEIDAVFTHEDGTVMKVPGFTVDNKKAWAVRFTPTKLGKWTYSITCSDASNTDLFANGTVNAVASTKETEIAKRGFVQISENKRYYTYADGTPFFWLGDTNWQAPNYVSYTSCDYPGCTCGSQLRHEVDNRVAKGFTVYQTYFETSGSSLWQKTYTKPDFSRFCNEIDPMFSYINEKGMVIALGFGLYTTPVYLNETDFFRFVRFCVARYGCYSVIWITGQEVTDNTPSATTKDGKKLTCLEVWLDIGNYVSQVDPYNHPNGAHMYVLQVNEARVQALDQSSWHNIFILQAGHGGSCIEKSFYQGYYLKSGLTKPYIEGEKNYEDINCGAFTGYNSVRKSAWKAILCGCCGYTYGASGIWIDSRACYGEDGSYSYDPWYIGLDKPGSYEMQYMREFFENIAWETLVPHFSDPTYMKFDSKIMEEMLYSSSADGKLAVCYFYNDTKTTGTIKKLAQGTFKAYWFDVITGKYIAIDDITVGENGECVLPEKPTADDWALVLTQGSLKNDIYTEKTYQDLGKGDIEGTITTPVKVTAIGGYRFQAKSNAQYDKEVTYLTDGDLSTVWTPNANRVAQTFSFDFGEAKDLTHIVITPSGSTILDRKLRVYGSNDGERWSLIVNNTQRDNYMEGTSISEKLSGGYRYVKVLLLTAENIDGDTAKTAAYKVHGNNKQYYAELEIAEIAVYTNGTATTIADDGKVSNNDIPQAVVDIEPVVTASDDTVLICIVIIAADVVIIGCAAVIIVKKLKKKEN